MAAIAYGHSQDDKILFLKLFFQVVVLHKYIDW